MGGVEWVEKSSQLSTKLKLKLSLTILSSLDQYCPVAPCSDIFRLKLNPSNFNSDLDQVRNQPYASLQICKFANMQVCKYASMQVCRCAMKSKI